jgi:hypothetical protein
VYSEEYKEINISDKKILTGISREDALEKFGIPSKTNHNFWYYDTHPSFYIYFPNNTHSLLNVFILPSIYRVDSKHPFEIKAFAYYPDFRIEEITSLVKWIIMDESVIKRKNNIFIPLKEGKTKIFTIYKDVLSNPCSVIIENLGKETKKEGLLRIDIFPYKPIVSQHEPLTFLAFGTFFNPLLKKFYVKNITDKVSWFVSYDKEEEKKLIKMTRNIFSFHYLGTAKIFCKYGNIKSNIQKVSVYKNIPFFKEDIRSIHLIPDIIIGNKGDIVEMKGIVTYSNNKVEDITQELDWNISNKNVASFLDKGKLKLKNEGISEIKSRLERMITIKSFPTKLLVRKDSLDLENKKDFITQNNIGREWNIETLMKEIGKNLKKMDKEISKKIYFIKIEPEFIKIPLGETEKVKVKAFYSDNSEVDVTSLVKWEIKDPQNIIIKNDEIVPLRRGRTTIYAYLNKIKSNSAEVIVTEPELLSIVLNFSKKHIAKGEDFSIKAFGCYTDNSKQDITQNVKWHIENEKIIKMIDKGLFKAMKKGKTTIYAQKDKIKSIPFKIEVFISPLEIFKKFLFFFFITISFFLLILYFKTKMKIIKLRKTIFHSPHAFIINIYENIKNVLKIFGFPYKETIPLLEYAKKVESELSIEKNIFLNLTYKFYEAKYSHHLITPEDALSFLENYNKCMKIIRKKVKNFFFKSFILLLLGYPFLI